MGDISGRWSSSQRCSVSVRQIRPRPYLAMKLMASGVIFSAAMVEVAFVFAVLVVHQDDHAALANFFDGFFDGTEGQTRFSHGKKSSPPVYGIPRIFLECPVEIGNRTAAACISGCWR